MKTLISTIALFALFAFSLSLQAAEFTCKIPDIEGMKGTTFTVSLGLDADTFTGLQDDSFKRNPTKEDRMRWNIIEIDSYSVIIDAHKQTLEVMKDGKLEKSVKLACQNVDEAEFEEISMLNTPGKLEAMGGYYSENNHIADDGRSSDEAFFESQKSGEVSGNSVNK